MSIKVRKKLIEKDRWLRDGVKVTAERPYTIEEQLYMFFEEEERPYFHTETHEIRTMKPEEVSSDKN